MKSYQDIIATSKQDRETALKESVQFVDTAATRKTELQRETAKILVAMVKGGDCGSQEMAKHAKEITGQDIRKSMQAVYPLAAVFTAIVDESIDMTEAEFDTLEVSKIALLSPYLDDEEKLESALELLRGGKSAKDIREVSGKEKKEPKAVKEQRERAEKAEADLERERSRTAGIEIECGFIATDIGKTDPLVGSKQLSARLKADIKRAMDSNAADILEEHLDFFTRAFRAICGVMDINPMEAMADAAAAAATPAKGGTVEVHAEIAA